MAAFHSHRPAFSGAASIFVYCQFKQANAASLLLAHRATMVDWRSESNIVSLFIYIYVYVKLSQQWTLQRCSYEESFFFHTTALHLFMTVQMQTKKYQMEAEEAM